MSTPLSATPTLVEVIRYKAAQAPEKRIFTYLRDGETEAQVYTYQTVDTRARAMAAALQAAAQPGDRALAIYPSSPEFTLGTLGALYAGVVPAPVLAPLPNQPPDNLLGILADTQAVAVLTTQALHAQLQPVIAAYPQLQALAWLETDGPLSAAPDDWKPVTLDPSALIFLLYTSGSTQQPRGIRITQGHIMQSMALVQRMPELPPGTLTVTWMPVQHTAGLGALVYPLISSTPLVMMPPQAFLERPARWLEAITKYQATSSGGANFAYELCVSRTTPEERAKLDLSSWRQASVGTGPVHARTLEDFATLYAPHGFKRAAFYVHYGLTELTSTISSGAPRTLTLDREALAENRIQPAAADAADPVYLVTGGKINPMARPIIVDPNTREPRPPDGIGEIWVPAAFAYGGYYQKPEINEATFNAHLADGTGPFMRTGDMGGLVEGEVIITGRHKDMLIVRGKNFYAEDLEQIAGRAHPALIPGAAAAFAVPGATEEEVTLLHEVQPGQEHIDVEAVAAVVRRAIANAFALPVHAVVLVPAGALPRTMSGKIRRHMARAQYLAAINKPA